MTVSILVFLDQALKADTIRGEGWVHGDVSILVFLDQALKEKDAPIDESLPEVSILVFLDQALKEQPMLIYMRRRTGFNPCFPGSSAERICRRKPEGSGYNVSILVFLDQALKDKWGRGPGSPGILFQSLFSWIKR